MIYLDNAATAPLHPKAREAMLPYLAETFANPSAVYKPARAVRKAVDEVRNIVANTLSATPGEIVFTSGGTEACNWAVKGIADMAKGKHIITSAIEHPAIKNTCKYLSTKGYDITIVPVCENGFVNPQDVENAIRPDTCLISIIFVSNEMGAIQPIGDIGNIAKRHGIPFHTDGVQAVGRLPIDVDALGIDLLSLSAHKFGGPKGVGALYVHKGTTMAPFMHGGAQERSRRAGTENTIGLVGMGAALAASVESMAEEQVRITKIRDYIIQQILDTIPHTKLNGPPIGEKRSPNNINISFRFIEGESLLLHLDMQNCYASTGSACSSGALEPSSTLMAIGLDHELANGALRFTLGRENTMADADALLKILTPTVKKLRDLSPLYDDFLKS